MPRFLRGRGHRPPDHGSGYTAGSANSHEISAQLSAVRALLPTIASLTDEQLSAVPPEESFRFCDGKRTVEEVLRALLKHQSRQLDTIRAATG